VHSRYKRLFPLLAVLAGCTPLGLWVYEDPSMALRSAAQLRVAGGQQQGDSLEFVMVGCNLNDYDLTGDSVRTVLSVAGAKVGEAVSTRPLLFATRDTSRFTLTVPLQATVAAQGQRQPFELLVISTLRTPLGVRELSYRLVGEVQVNAEQFAWRVPQNRGCKPGGSVLPGVFDRRIPLDTRSRD
jgi:hypothetical protein